MPTRRTLLGAVPVAALAGCAGTETTGSSPESTGTATTTPSLPMGLSRAGDGFSIDLAAMTSGSVTVEGPTVSYTKPTEVRWVATAIRDGTPVEDPATSDRLRATGTIPTEDVPAARLLPVFDGTEYQYRLYANAAFRDLASWTTVLARPGDTEVERAYEVPTTFEDVPGTDLGVAVVSNADATLDVSSAEPLLPAVTNYGYDALTSTTPDDITGVLLSQREVSTGPEPPQVAVEFEYLDGELTITHGGGDTVEATRLSVTVNGEAANVSFSGDVSAGDSVTLTGVETGDTVRVVWHADGEAYVIARSVAP